MIAISCACRVGAKSAKPKCASKESRLKYLGTNVHVMLLDEVEDDEVAIEELLSSSVSEAVADELDADDGVDRRTGTHIQSPCH